MVEQLLQFSTVRQVHGVSLSSLRGLDLEAESQDLELGPELLPVLAEAVERQEVVSGVVSGECSNGCVFFLCEVA